MLALVPLWVAARAAPAAPPRFDILEFEVEGNTVLAAVAVERVLMPFMGPERTIDDAEAARAALEKAYQAAGYLTVFVDLPEQRVDGGVVRLAVLEGRIERLAVTGARYFDQGELRTRVPELQPGRVPNFNEVQRQLGAVNTSEDRRVQPILKPGVAPGTVQAELQVQDKLPLTATLEVSNAAPQNTDPLRTTASLRYDNLWQRGHSASLSFTTAPTHPGQTAVAVLNYGVPLSGGDQLAAYAVHSNSNIESLGGTRVLGKGNTYGLRWVLALAQTETSSHTATLGADYRDVEELIRQGTEQIAKPLRYAPLSATYTGNWATAARQTQLTASFSAGLRPLLARRIDGCELENGSLGNDDQFRCKRKGSDGGFSTLRLDARHTEVFEWFSLQARVSAQVATQQLSSAEQFTVGGADTVRGYYEGAAAGDHGALASLELRSPNLALWLQRAHPGSRFEDLAELTVLTFVDAASLATVNPDAGQNARQPLLGTGAGLRVQVRPGASFELLAARPHKALAQSPRAGARLHARMSVKF